MTFKFHPLNLIFLDNQPFIVNAAGRDPVVHTKRIGRIGENGLTINFGYNDQRVKKMAEWIIIFDFAMISCTDQYRIGFDSGTSKSSGRKQIQI
jgi:hypothetical protein